MSEPLVRAFRDRRNVPVRARRLERLQQLFIDLPGMQLSSPQAARLLGVELSAANRMLRGLVEAGLLRAAEDGRFGRAFPGRQGRRSA